MIDNSFGYNDPIVAAISELDRVVSVTPHLESFTLASSGTQTKGVAVIAIDTEKEKNFSDPASKLVGYRITEKAYNRLKESGVIPDDVLQKVQENMGRSYVFPQRITLELELTGEESEKYLPEILQHTRETNRYLAQDDEGILVSDKLAGYLKVAAGDSVILMGQGYHGISATGIFPVRGIIKMPSPEIDNRLIVMTLPAAWKLFDAEGKITALVVNLTDKSNRSMKSVKAGIKALIPDPGITTKTWAELNPVLYQQIQGDSQSGQAMLAILYFIIFFGIFGTVLMMVSERKREFGVLVAIGMQKKKLKRIVTLEMLMLGFVGLVSGLAAGAPLIMYYYYHPYVFKGDLAVMMEDWGWEAVMPTAWFGPYFYMQAVIVALMVLLATLYPLRKIGKMKEIEALRS